MQLGWKRTEEEPREQWEESSTPEGAVAAL